MADKTGFTELEELKEKCNTPDAVFEGVKAANGWKAGKAVTEAEYMAAVKAFNDAPMDGRVTAAGKKVVKK